jgi:hypothetical protein
MCCRTVSPRGLARTPPQVGRDRLLSAIRNQIERVEVESGSGVRSTVSAKDRGEAEIDHIENGTMIGYVTNIENDTLKNEDYRRVLFTGRKHAARPLVFF